MGHDKWTETKHKVPVKTSETLCAVPRYPHLSIILGLHEQENGQAEWETTDNTSCKKIFPFGPGVPRLLFIPF